MIWLPIVGKYADADVYASILAYEELLNQCGKIATNYIPIAPNYSVPEKLRLPRREHKTFDFNAANDQAIIFDVSIPDVIYKFAKDTQILEIVDHHPGYEEYWYERLGDKAIIEEIGAVATLISEWWGERCDYKKMSPEIAKLLLAAILDNTLNFSAAITTSRDHKAAENLAKIIGISVKDFAKWYFATVSQTICQDLANALTNDTKTTLIPNLNSKFAFGQLTFWDADKVTSQTAQIRQVMNQTAPDWIVSIINVSQKQNYILVSSSKLAKYFVNLLELEQNGDWLISHQLYLRKEIMAKIFKEKNG